MTVEVRIPTMMRPDAGGQATAQANGSTVAEVLEDLVLQFPRLQGKFTNEDGSLHKFVNVYVNDEDVRYLERLDTKVADGDEIAILPAVAGG
ncbi:MAG TPA: ubiquitin-like small modifier protein 1 [Acidimicrobiales bacterium]|jgi:MoaD family protein|nr:ubiquitin-like small modifier protein 1 [Acidimicrobiales bacterium]